MASAGGLSRRRVGGATSSSSNSTYNDADDDDRHLRGTSSTNGKAANGVAGGSSGSSTPQTALHAGSAFEGGSKIAFDPRDLQQDAGEEARIGGKMPRLTIMEEVLLLGIKDKQVRFLSPISLLVRYGRAMFIFHPCPYTLPFLRLSFA